MSEIYSIESKRERQKERERERKRDYYRGRGRIYRGGEERVRKC